MFEPLEAPEIVPLQLLESLPNERLRRLQLGNDAVLEGVHAPLAFLDFFDQSAQRRFDLRRHGDILDEGLVRLRGFVDPRRRRDDSVAAVLEFLADALRVDLRDDDPHHVLRLELECRDLLGSQRRGLDADRPLDRSRNGDALLRNPVFLRQVRPERLRAFEDPKELNDEGVSFQLEEPVAPLRGPPRAPKLEQLRPRGFVLREDHPTHSPSPTRGTSGGTSRGSSGRSSSATPRRSSRGAASRSRGSLRSSGPPPTLGG